jgi:hypothetical protein
VAATVAVKNQLYHGMVRGYRKETYCPYPPKQVAALERQIDADASKNPPIEGEHPVFVLEKWEGKPYTRIDMSMAEITNFAVYKAKLLEGCPAAEDVYAHWIQVRKRAMCKKYAREGAKLTRFVIQHDVIFKLELGPHAVSTLGPELLDYVPMYNELSNSKFKCKFDNMD